MSEEDQEIWKTYPDYPFIEASNFGRVRTVDHWVTYKDGRKRLYKGHVLKQQLRKDNYMQVLVSVNGKQVGLFVHRVVATSHLPNPDNLPEVNHKDNDRTNNRSDNLEWCTSEYNVAYREKYGVTCNHPVIAVNRETGEVLWFKSQREAARQLNVNQAHVNKIVKGKRYYKTTYGYWFCNADENAVEKTREEFGDDIANEVEKLMRES